jgi:hypothetical protein
MTAAYPSVPAVLSLRAVPQARSPLWRQLIDAVVEGRRRAAEEFMTQYSGEHPEFRE